MRVVLVAVLLAFATGGCGALNGHDEKPAAVVTNDQLAIMVLPQDEVGPAGAGMRIDDESGPSNNNEGADDTIDPKDTASSLARAGRLRGYDLMYSSPRQVAIWRKGGGYTDVSTSVELFETESAASAYLYDQIHDFERFRGRQVGHGLRLASSEVFDVVGVGDEAAGVRGTFRYQDLRVKGTLVAFRRGRIVASASIGRGDKRDITEETRTLALALDGRIRKVLAGELDAEPVPLARDVLAEAAERVSAMTLSRPDLPARVTVLHEQRKIEDDRVDYVRQFGVEGARFGGSRFLTLRAETQVVADEAYAREAIRTLASPHGRRLMVRSFAKAFARDSGVEARDLRSRRLVGLPPDAAGVAMSVQTPKGPFEAVILTVRVRNAVETLSAFGPASAVDPRDLEALAEKSRARLDANLPRV